jgi:nucleotide-binding universal stress UspA family protein
VLFPGHVAASTRPNWRSILLLLVLPAALIYPGLSFHLFEPDEGRYAEIPREMIELAHRRGAKVLLVESVIKPGNDPDMGKIMAALKQKYAGRIDFGEASARVKAKLAT